MPWDPDTLDPENDHHREVYAHYGLAMYCAQVLERELTNFLVVSRTITGKFTTREEQAVFDDALSGWTMGRQLRAALEENHLDPIQVDALERALAARNFLAHDFFGERIGKFMTERGRNELLKELDELRDTFVEADALVSPITLVLMELGGVTAEVIREEVERFKADAMAANDLRHV